MPIYEYKCMLKGHKTVVQTPIIGKGPDQRVTCDCGDRAVLQVTAAAVVFKGPGFYSTDNRPTDHD